MKNLLATLTANPIMHTDIKAVDAHGLEYATSPPSFQLHASDDLNLDQIGTFQLGSEHIYIEPYRRRNGTYVRGHWRSKLIISRVPCICTQFGVKGGS